MNQRTRIHRLRRRQASEPTRAAFARRESRRAPAGFAALALAVAALAAVPATTAAASAWTLTVTPSSVTQGSTTEFAARVTLTAGGSVGCITVTVPSAFDVTEARVTATRTGAPWSAFAFGNHIWLVSSSGAGRLSGGDWVEVAVRAGAGAPGTYGWVSAAGSGPACGAGGNGPTDLAPTTGWVTITPAAAPTPTPAPSAPAEQSTAQPTPVESTAPTGAPSAPSGGPAPSAPAGLATPTPDRAGSAEPGASARPTEGAASGTEPSPDPSTTPSPYPSAELVVPVRPERRDGDASAGTQPRDMERGLARPGDRQPPSRPVDSAVRERPPEHTDVLAQLVDSAADGIGRAISPAAAAQVATSFSFPLALMVAVLLYVVVQDQIDRRDPKLRVAPRTVFDTIVRFRDEAEI